jgi:tetratricopeptide (TPR) repeat protein
MGSVWSGVHASTGHPIAIKVLALHPDHEVLFRAAFHAEIRAIAALTHPHIVRILEHGEIPAETARQSLGRLKAGAPYLVMDRAETTLHHHHANLDWPVLRTRLSELLRALAHAHARGIIHRDVKPSNLLLATLDGPLVLADFGLTHRQDTEIDPADVVSRAGTPIYMSPEQVQGRWREFGPWTDLYAVGCVAWALLTGRPPHRRGHAEDTLIAQIQAPLPPLKARIDVPGDLLEWMSRLLEKAPGARFQRAADALSALQNVGSGPVTTVQVFLEEESSQTQSTQAGSQATPITDVPDTADELELLDLEAWPPRPPGAVPFPATWRSLRVTETAWLPGAGLELCRFRGMPLVARESERDRLWALLAGVERTQEPAICLIRGASGVGKSRLARWLCEWGHETGAAVALRALHGSHGGPVDGLGAMLRRHLNASGLSGDALVRRVSLAVGSTGMDLGWGEATALAALIEGPATELPVRFSGPRERYVLLEKLLAGLGTRRPIVLWIDDGQWGLDALGFAEHLARSSGSRCPVLVLITLQEEALASAWITQEAVKGLAKQGQTLALGPLDESASRDLVRQLLALQPDLAAQVQKRAGGNPLFAVQLVRDWAQRDLLVTSPQGFGLRPGARPGLPKPLQALWIDRVEHVLHGRSTGEKIALEAAAVLGQEVDRQEWEDVCGHVDGNPTPKLLRALERQHLIQVRRDGGFGFAHGMLREAVVERAGSEGRAAGLHSACAELLAGSSEPATVERRVRHLGLAGRGAEALDPLMGAIDTWIRRSEIRRVRALLVQADSLLATLKIPQNDPRRGRLGLVAAQVAMWLTGPAEAESLLDALAEHIDNHGWDTIRADELTLRGRIAYAQGDLTGARALYQEADTRYLIAGDVTGAAENKINLSQVSKFLGDIDGARVYARSALRLAEAISNPYTIVLTLHECATVALKLGNRTGCQAFAERCLELASTHGFRSNQAKSQLQLGELARLQGDLDSAESAYAAALDIFLGLERAIDALVARLNRILVLLSRERFGEAREQLQLAMAQPGVDPGHGLMSAVALGLVVCDGAEQDWAGWDQHFSACQAGLARTGLLDPDLGRLALQAGRLALAAGDPFRGALALSLAERQFAATGPAEELAVVRGLQGRGSG